MLDFQDGDVLVTYGRGGLWPPRRWLLWMVYRGIRAYQKAKWGQGSDAGPTHVRVWLSGRFFEMTTPAGRWTPRAAVLLEKKTWKVARYRRRGLDVSAMEARARVMVGRKYDIGDLLDFGLSGLVRKFAGRIRLFGDRLGKYTVCSTALAKVLRAGGAEMRISRDDLPPGAGIESAFAEGEAHAVLQDKTIDPAYFVNNPSHWEIVAASG